MQVEQYSLGALAPNNEYAGSRSAFSMKMRNADPRSDNALAVQVRSERD